MGSGESDASIGLCVLACVAQQVVEREAHHVRIEGDLRLDRVDMHRWVLRLLDKFGDEPMQPCWETDDLRRRVAPAGHSQQRGNQGVQPVDLPQYCFQSRLAADTVAGEGVFHAQAHRRHRVAKLVGDPGGHAAKCRQAFPGGKFTGHCRFAPACLHQALAAGVQRGDDAVQIRHAGRVQPRQRRGVLAQIPLDGRDAAIVSDDEGRKPRRRADDDSEEDAEAPLERIGAGCGFKAGEGPGG